MALDQFERLQAVVTVAACGMMNGTGSHDLALGYKRKKQTEKGGILAIPKIFLEKDQVNQVSVG